MSCPHHPEPDPNWVPTHLLSVRDRDRSNPAPGIYLCYTTLPELMSGEVDFRDIVGISPIPHSAILTPPFPRY